MASEQPWEHGSELTVAAKWSLGGERAESPWSEDGRFFGSGRDALRALLRHGARELGWKRALVPYYFCQEVVGAAALELPIKGYVDRPLLGSPSERSFDARSGDVVLVVNYYGLRSSAWSFQAPGVCVIEDHTHDPWSDWARTSTADYAIVSLRKTLPLPDGGVVWSPAGRSLPPTFPVTEERQRASERKLVSQVLKTLYLEGHSVSKAAFRELALESEEHMASGPISGMPEATRSLLEVFPTQTWREIRRRNFDAAEQLLKGSSLSLLTAESPDSVPFSLLLLATDNQRREAIRAALPKLGVFPAVLWWLTKPAVEGIPEEDHAFSGRLLSIACDYRYSIEHMTELVRKIEAT